MPPAENLFLKCEFPESETGPYRTDTIEGLTLQGVYGEFGHFSL